VARADGVPTAAPAPATAPATPAPVPKAEGTIDPAAKLDETRRTCQFHMLLALGAPAALKIEQMLNPPPLPDGRQQIWAGGTPVVEPHHRLYWAVGRELDFALTPKLAEELAGIEPALRTKYEKTPPPDDRVREKVQLERGTEYHTAASGFWGRVLTPKQAKRFLQIEHQYLALGGMGGPRFQTTLNLTPDQLRRIGTVRDEVTRDWNAKAGLQELVFDPVHGKEVMQLVNRASRWYQLHAAARDRTLGLLTDAQRAAWRELTGTPVDLESVVGRGSTLYGR
jgi:hypothetical protein